MLYEQYTIYNILNVYKKLHSQPKTQKKKLQHCVTLNTINGAIEVLEFRRCDSDATIGVLALVCSHWVIGHESPNRWKEKESSRTFHDPVDGRMHVSYLCLREGVDPHPIPCHLNLIWCHVPVHFLRKGRLSWGEANLPYMSTTSNHRLAIETHRCSTILNDNKSCHFYS